MLPFRYNNGIRVYQSPGYVSIALEMLGDPRDPIRSGNDAQHWPEPVEAWLGNSVGHWEGNTLVIETTNIKTGDSATKDMFARNGSPLNMATMGVPPFNTIPTSDKAKVVERLTPTGPDSIIYEMTYSDPEVFTAPFTARLDWTRNSELRVLRVRLPRGRRAGPQLHHRGPRRTRSRRPRPTTSRPQAGASNN